MDNKKTDVEKTVGGKVPTNPVIAKKFENTFYSKAMWHGVIPTFRCIKCDTFIEDEDDMILHVITHLNESEREAVMNGLLSLKKRS